MADIGEMKIKVTVDFKGIADQLREMADKIDPPQPYLSDPHIWWDDRRV